MTMRKLNLFAALVVAMTAASCVQEMQTETPAPEVNGAVTFEASFGAATKAVLELGATESKVAWEAGDQVGVLAGEGKFLYEAQEPGYSTKLLTEATGVPAEGPYYAVYPYDDDAVLAEGVITTTLPAVQTAVLGSFTTHLSVAQAVENKFAFKNVCGLVGVKIDAENVTKIVLEGNNGEIVAGAINVTVADAPTWTAVAEEGATSVTLEPAEGTLAKGVYYFAVLPQTFEKGFNVKAYKGDDAYVLRNVSAEYELKRSDIVGSKAFGIEGEGTEASPYILKTAQDMVDMRSLAKLGGETWFKMANDIDLKGINWVPVNYDENFERKIHFDGCDFTISNLTCDKAASKSNYASLFGVLYGSCKNLKIDKATITSSNACGVIGGYVGTSGKPGLVENVTITNSLVTNTGTPAGGACGVAREGSFKNVSFQGEIVSTNDKSTSSDNGFTAVSANAGGFAGLTTGTASFENCSTDVTISSKDSDFAGFVGQVQGTVTFTDCSTKAIVNSSQEQKLRCAAFVGYSNGVATYTRCKVLEGSSINDVTGLTNNRLLLAGGFMGYAGGTSVTAVDCTVDVNVDLPYGQTVGGFVGNVGAGTFKATGCSVSGNVKGNNQVAGFVAYQEKAASLEISTSYSTATVTGGGHYTAGFAGYLVNDTDKPVKFTNCYATGDVTSTGSSCSGFFARVEQGVELTGCYAECDLSAANNSGGVLGYIQNGPATIKDCHFKGNITGVGSLGGLIGAAYTDVNQLTIEGCYSEGTVTAKGSHVGGIIGAPQAKSQTITDTWSSADVTLLKDNTTAEPKHINVGGIAGSATSYITLQRCYATGDITNANAFNSYGHVGGLIGRATAGAKIEECYFTGTAKGHYYVGGLLGQLGGGTLDISKSYATGVVTGNVETAGRYHGGVVGLLHSSATKTTITNCWTSNNVSGEQFIGGIVGSAESPSEVSNCFSNGTLKARGVGGMIGRIQNTATVSKCLAWNTINSTRTGATQYASGAITGSVTKSGNFSACYRASDMSYYDKFVPSPVDHDDITNAQPPAPAVGTVDANQYAYHGKAVGTGITASAQAKTLGWDETVWDLSGTVPVLK